MPPETETMIVPPEKPKRRKGKAKRPAADAPPRKPRTTLRSRIDAMGPTHLAAYRVLCDGAEFDAALRDALNAEENERTAYIAWREAEEKLAAAKAALTKAEAASTAAQPIIARLDKLARDIATAREDVPSADDAHAPTVAPASDSD